MPGNASHLRLSLGDRLICLLFQKMLLSVYVGLAVFLAGLSKGAATLPTLSPRGCGTSCPCSTAHHTYPDTSVTG